MRRRTVLLTLALGGQALPSAAQGLAPGAWRVVRTEIVGAIATSLKTDPASHAAVLSALAARLIMWDVDLRKELERGDKLSVVYREDPGTGVLSVGALRYQSGRHAAVFDAYLWQAPGDGFPSYFRDTGEEVPRRLNNGPLRGYDQITSLLKDRPTHKGMDFKTPVGTPVYAHKAGHVRRANWRHGPNGNCLEIAYDDGTTARYLHLSAVKVSSGVVARGQVIALTGNTGRSTAPHLHYELERGGRIVDPIDVHGTSRRVLPADTKQRFLEATKELHTLLGKSQVGK